MPPRLPELKSLLAMRMLGEDVTAKGTSGLRSSLSKVRLHDLRFVGSRPRLVRPAQPLAWLGRWAGRL